MTAIWQDFQKIILPGITHWNHPGFMAYFANTGSPPGILAELLIAALNVNAMLWRTSPFFSGSMNARSRRHCRTVKIISVSHSNN